MLCLSPLAGIGRPARDVCTVEEPYTLVAERVSTTKGGLSVGDY